MSQMVPSCLVPVEGAGLWRGAGAVSIGTPRHRCSTASVVDMPSPQRVPATAGEDRTAQRGMKVWIFLY